MSDVKLLPCPFCGESEGVACTWDIARDDHYVECDKCEISGPRKDTQLEALSAWNTRPAPALTPKQAAADEMFEAINELLDNDGTRGVFDGRGLINARNRLFAILAKAGQP